MQENASDATAFLVVLCLPLIGWIISRPPIWLRLRARLEPTAVRLWRQVIEPEQPDEDDLRRWAVVRLKELQGHLERVRRLILDDEWMTATRQTANRMAHEHLLRDVRDAAATLAAYGLEPLGAAGAPTPLSATRFAYSAPAVRSVSEVIEFGPRGRWL